MVATRPTIGSSRFMGSTLVTKRRISYDEINPVIRRWMADAIGPARAFYYLQEFFSEQTCSSLIVFPLQDFNHAPRKWGQFAVQKAALIQNLVATWVCQ